MSSFVQIRPRIATPAAPANHRAATFAGRPRPAQLNHLFVSNARFWCMISIIAVHASSVFSLFGEAHTQTSLAANAFMKFGTIGFFLISGFLLGERVDRRDPFEYFGRRLKRVFLPWLCWIAALCTLYLAHRLSNVQSSAEALKIVSTTFFSCVFDSAFWFVPNLLLCIAILLAFRGYLYSWKLGAILLAANLVYVVNIYTLWFTSSHSHALFGYVFYLWLGSYAAHHFNRISDYLARIPTAALVTLASVFALLAYGESAWLVALNNPQPLNTLRASNQIFSISMVLVFFKFTRPTWPRFIDVRRHTFGLYLSHTIVLAGFLYFYKYVPTIHFGSQWIADLAAMTTWLALATTTYMICLGITAWIANRPSLQWMVGLNTQDAPRSSANDLESTALARTLAIP